MRIFLLTVAFLFALAEITSAQQSFDDPPGRVPAHASSQKDTDQRISLHEYTLGLLLVHEERYDDALKAFAKAARLDPDAPAIFKAQAPLFIGLGRYAEGLDACKKVVALDALDYSAWYAQAKLQKMLLKYPEAIAALESGLKAPALKEHPEAAHLLYIELGGLCEATDRYGAAADAYHKAVALLEHVDQVADKGHLPRAAVLARTAETYEQIGQLYRKAKRYDDALAAYRKAQECVPEKSARLSLTLAQICTEKGDLAPALGHVEEYLRTRPLSTEPHELKVRLLRGLRKSEQIVPWLEEAADQERFNTHLQLILARECAAARLWTKAETHYRKLAEETAGAEAYRGWFNVHKENGAAGMALVLGILESAVNRVSRAKAPIPISAGQHLNGVLGALRDDGPLARALVERAAKESRELGFDTLGILAELADKEKQYEQAERFYRASLNHKERTAVAEPILYSGLLRTLSAVKKHEAMVKTCEEGLTSVKTVNPLLFYKELARAHAALNRYDDAIGAAEQAAKLAGADKRLLFDLLRVRILVMAERQAEAESACLALLKKHEHPAEVIELRYLLSNVFGAAKQQAKAEEQLQLILKLDPENAAVNNDLGYLWADQNKNLPEAEAMIRKALDNDRLVRRRNPAWRLESDRDNAAYVDSLGWVLFRRGLLEEARQELERAAQLEGGDDPVIHDHLGDVYERLKMRPEAVRAWQRALELYEQGVRGKDDDRIRAVRAKIGGQ